MLRHPSIHCVIIVSLSLLVRIARWPGNLWRAFVVGLVATACLLSYLFLRIGAIGIFPKQRRVSWLARVRGRLLRWFVTASGATFIKLAQVMSTRPDLFRPEMIAELRKLQDQLPAFSFRKVRKIVEADLGAPLEDHFKEFDEAALAAASVAQVHRALLVDGTEVAVKVLRPGVERHVKRDGAILMFFAKVTNLHPRVRLSAPVEHMKEFVDAIAAQTSLRAEAANYERFHANFVDLKEIHFPEVYPALCADRVLTMEFIHGKKIDNLGPGSHVATAKLTRTAFFKMCFDDGFVHADLHPGNMLVNNKGHLIIFDVGMVKLITEETKLQFVDFPKCVSMGDSAECPILSGDGDLPDAHHCPTSAHELRSGAGVARGTNRSCERTRTEPSSMAKTRAMSWARHPTRSGRSQVSSSVALRSHWAWPHSWEVAASA